MQVTVDPVLPCQLDRRKPWTPEQRLCWAMLDAVCRDLDRHELVWNIPGMRGRKESPRQAAFRYIYRKDPCWPYAFDGICEAVGIDADLFRAALERRAA